MISNAKKENSSDNRYYYIIKPQSEQHLRCNKHNENYSARERNCQTAASPGIPGDVCKRRRAQRERRPSNDEHAVINHIEHIGRGIIGYEHAHTEHQHAESRAERRGRAHLYKCAYEHPYGYAGKYVSDILGVYIQQFGYHPKDESACQRFRAIQKDLGRAYVARPARAFQKFRQLSPPKEIPPARWPEESR